MNNSNAALPKQDPWRRALRQASSHTSRAGEVVGASQATSDAYLLETHHRGCAQATLVNTAKGRKRAYRRRRSECTGLTLRESYSIPSGDGFSGSLPSSAEVAGGGGQEHLDL